MTIFDQALTEMKALVAKRSTERQGFGHNCAGQQ